MKKIFAMIAVLSATCVFAHDHKAPQAEEVLLLEEGQNTCNSDEVAVEEAELSKEIACSCCGGNDKDK